MDRKASAWLLLAAAVAMGTWLAGCAVQAPKPPVTVAPTHPNAVSYWHAVAARTINAPPAPDGTAAERRPDIAYDLAYVQVAVYDALAAIDGGYQPYTRPPLEPARSASPEAAVGAAAHAVLEALYPHRAARYEQAFEDYVRELPGGAARTQGLALGSEAAHRLLAMRGDDGRLTALPDYVPGTATGQYRGRNPVNRHYASMKPWALARVDQFRAPPPPAPGSEIYWRDWDETRTLGGAGSASRTPQQFEVARFHTESPAQFWPRNLRRFAMTDASLMEHARLMALLSVATADAQLACFDSKYRYQAWRPESAITLLDDADGSGHTRDADWKPSLPTPPHPEYPAAHACVAGSVAGILEGFYGTRQVRFAFDSTATQSTRTYASPQELVDEVQLARIAGGMHFRSATESGDRLGRQVAQWVLGNYFRPVR